jgi:hypothetical protein
MKFDQVLSQLSETFGVNQNNNNQNNVNQTNTNNVTNNQNNKPATPVTTNPPQQNKPTTPVNSQKLDIKNPVVAELVKAQKPEEVLAALTKLGLTTNK